MAEKCAICGKELYAGIISGNVGGKCRICGRVCCNAHYKDRLCPYCREKLSKK